MGYCVSTEAIINVINNSNKMVECSSKGHLNFLLGGVEVEEKRMQERWR